MDTTPRNILVPWDFTPSSNYALQHAIKIAKVMNLNISLIHIITQAKEEAKWQAKLKTIASDAQSNSGIETTVLIQSGDVLTSISELASFPDTALVVMKTDGIRGMQRYTGSLAMKIMRGSKAPFIVVQQPPVSEGFQRIVYPIDYRPENKELITSILHLCKYYSNTKLFLFWPQVKDRIFRKNVANNVNFAKMMFDAKKMNYEVCVGKGKKNYAAEVNDFAKSVNSDLIVIQLQRNLTLSKFLFGVKEQNIVANPYKIPVMCISPKELRVYAGFR
jgi:nucleotide-binding universal stress UspA family protein